MSASPIARQVTQSQNIPAKRVVIDDPAQLPADYSATPGGTLYSTTPGGTRIVYERAFLMNLRNSPISRTPPCNVPADVLKSTSSSTAPEQPKNTSTAPSSLTEESTEQFQMDM